MDIQEEQKCQDVFAGRSDGRAGAVVLKLFQVDDRPVKSGAGASRLSPCFVSVGFQVSPFSGRGDRFRPFERGFIGSQSSYFFAIPGQEKVIQDL